MNTHIKKIFGTILGTKKDRGCTYVTKMPREPYAANKVQGKSFVCHSCFQSFKAFLNVPTSVVNVFVR